MFTPDYACKLSVYKYDCKCPFEYMKLNINAAIEL